MKRQIFEKLTYPIVSLFRKANVINVNLAERISPVYKIKWDDKKLNFYCPNKLSLWRAQTLFTKEPDTIKWINSFNKKDIFYDIGANVGIYSLYAGASGMKVFAFEPESQNYAAFNRNIYLNNMQECINALNIAISDDSRIGHLFIKEFTIGGALNNFGECINYKKEKFNPGYKQAVTSFKLDDLVEQYQLPLPNHIKIDVDGLEYAVIAGSQNLLKNDNLKSMLVELNLSLDSDKKIINILKDYGFELESYYRAPIFAQSEFKDIYNHIFKRI